VLLREMSSRSGVEGGCFNNTMAWTLHRSLETFFSGPGYRNQSIRLPKIEAVVGADHQLIVEWSNAVNLRHSSLERSRVASDGYDVHNCCQEPFLRPVAPPLHWQAVPRTNLAWGELNFAGSWRRLVVVPLGATPESQRTPTLAQTASPLQA
jgi:hypothetical protein